MSPDGIAQLKTDEGCARLLPDGTLAAYPDPITKGDPWTIGYGSTGPTIVKGTVWTQTHADADLSARIAKLELELDVDVPWWRDMNTVRQDALVNLAYNLGVEGLMGFRQTIDALRVRNYPLAAENLLLSKAARELPRRYGRLAAQIKSGAAS